MLTAGRGDASRARDLDLDQEPMNLMPEERNAVDELSEEQLAEVPDHLEDQQVSDAPAAAIPRSSPLRFARMSGSSIAGRDAAAWVTDFLNAAFYRHPVDERDVDDMRLAFAVLTTYWTARRAAGACA